MAQAPTKDKHKKEKDNIFIDILYNVIVYVPALIVSWIWNKITDEI